MGRTYDTITDAVGAFIREQPMCFVGTAPLDEGGAVVDLVGQRARMVEWGDAQSTAELNDYMQQNNTVSIDGLPAWEG